LQSLYNLGARHFQISGTGHLGCVPFLTSRNAAGTCINVLNQLSDQYNTVASLKLRQLRSQLQGMRYSYSNVYRMTSDMKENPSLYGKFYAHFFSGSNIGIIKMILDQLQEEPNKKINLHTNYYAKVRKMK
jgi:GDSL-like Lipase/Acylhydrolase